MRVALPVALALAGALTGLPVPVASAAAPARRIAMSSWDARTDLARGTVDGLVVRKGRLRFGSAAGTRGRHEYGTWTSRWVKPGFELTELVPSWQATTPGASWVRVEVRGRSAGRSSSWDTLASWAHGDRFVRRTSPGSQTDDLG